MLYSCMGDKTPPKYCYVSQSLLLPLNSMYSQFEYLFSVFFFYHMWSFSVIDYYFTIVADQMTGNETFLFFK